MSNPRVNKKRGRPPNPPSNDDDLMEAIHTRYLGTRAITEQQRNTAFSYLSTFKKPIPPIRKKINGTYERARYLQQDKRYYPFSLKRKLVIMRYGVFGEPAEPIGKTREIAQ